jgi:predicted enzyme related to lactoylglutathione lyase
MLDQRISFITLGVNDFTLMKTWYQNVFGWTPFKEERDLCFFRLNGCILGLYPATALAEDIDTIPRGSGFKRFALSINLRSERDVDSVFSLLEDRGARIVRPPEKVFWGGYRGYLADPEDNFWELAYNPFIPLDEDGNIAG